MVVLSPGMGDLRASFRYQVPALVEAGYRAVSVDLRGHGESDTSFSTYGDEATSEDLTAVIESCGAPAVVVGNSMSAGAAVITAARHPQLVSGLVLVGPFVRNPPLGPVQKTLMSVLMTRPLAVALWKSYLPKLFAGEKPADFDEYRTAVVKSMSRRAYRDAFIATTKTSHELSESLLSRVTARSMVIMGEKDPDFKDPRNEAEWIGKQLSAQVEIVADSGHYPHSQQPRSVNSLLVDFLSKVARNG